MKASNFGKHVNSLICGTIILLIFEKFLSVGKFCSTFSSIANNSMELHPPGKLLVAALLKNFATFYVTQKLNTPSKR
jgi:hypothetical protein